MIQQWKVPQVRRRCAAVTVCLVLLAIVLFNTSLIVSLRSKVDHIREIAETVVEAANATREIVEANESSLEALKIDQSAFPTRMVPTVDSPFLFPTDQMFHEFEFCVPKGLNSPALR